MIYMGAWGLWYRTYKFSIFGSHSYSLNILTELAANERLHKQSEARETEEIMPDLTLNLGSLQP